MCFRTLDLRKMKKPRILIPITIQFSVRYILRTGLLNLIKDYAIPIVLLGWQDLGLIKELEEMGVEVHQNPGKKMGVPYYRVRQKLDLWHFDRIKSSSTKIDRRRNSLLRSNKVRFRIIIRDAYNRLGTITNNLQKKAIESEKHLLLTDTNYSQHKSLIEQLKPDLVLSLTPYFFEEELTLRAAQSLNIPIIASILSFDNITTRGWMPIIFDRYCVWNQYNKNELLRIYPEICSKSIEIVGAPQFDFYFDSTYIWNKDDWLKRLGLPGERPIILFGSGPEAISPLEPHWLAQLDDAIEKGEITGHPVILHRRHPVDTPNRWVHIQKNAKNIFFDDPWIAGKDSIGKTNITREDIEKLASTLYHTQVHINTSSTMTLDGAILDKPQIGPAYDDKPGKRFDRAMQELYQREHFLPITDSGGLEIAKSRNELVQMISNAIMDPGRLCEERKIMVKKICTFDDGKSSERLNRVIQEFMANGSY